MYVDIMKFDEQPDGTALVYGKATDDTLDSDQQVCDPEWLKTAMPEWFKYGNIREQHSAIAAGVATEYENKGSEHFITAHVVDPNSVKKVKAGVLKGFSIGIKAPRVVKDNKAIGGRIVDGQIVEVSLVDRPANPSCTLTLSKMDGSSLVQVEELNKEADDELILDVNTVEDVQAHDEHEVVPTEPELDEQKSDTTDLTKEHLMQADSIVEASKQYATGDITKFDQGAFDLARQALATLIQVEAGEMAEGEDESHSLACLLLAVRALFDWHAGEAAGGETEPIEDEEGEHHMELATEPEETKADGDIEMCDKCNKSMDECKCAEGGFVATEKTTVSDELRTLVADIVKSLLPTTLEGGEDAVTKAVESERIEALESELAQVKALAAPSGPSRMGVVSNKTAENVELAKAQMYRIKAKNTLDADLAKGYLALAKEIESNQTSK